MKKKRNALLLSAAGLCGVLLLSYAAAEPKASTLPALEKQVHLKYINGYEDGSFRPNQSITRAEICKMLSTLLSQKSDGNSVSFTDVEPNAWYAKAIDTLSGFSLINGYADGSFRPNEAMTRAELVSLLSRFSDTADKAEGAGFSDVAPTHWAYNAIAAANAKGWVTGYEDGSFHPNAALTRAEVVTILNRVLGRSGDAIMAATGENIRVMPDVPSEHWAYLAMLEASTVHEYQMQDGQEKWTSYEAETTALAQGWHNIEGGLYYVTEQGIFARNTKIDGLTLDHNGRYTTGDAALDAQLAEVAEQVLADLPQEQWLRAMYDYAKQSFSYLGIGESDTTKPDWTIEQAKQMLSTKKGNCYSWASAFTQLARRAGYPAQAVVGQGVSPKGNRSEHAWTEITINGTAYTFDPQIESVYAARYGEQYDLYQKEYGKAEWGYEKQQTEDTEEPAAPEADAELAALMEKIYGKAGTPTAMQQTVLSAEMGKDGQGYPLSYFVGTDDLPIVSGLASEPMMSSIAHSIVVARFAEGADMQQIAEQVRQKVDGYKWICVGVSPENILVETEGNLLVLVMDEDRAADYLANFRAATAAA